MDDDHHRSGRQIDLAGQRRRLATVAANIAHTEDLVADTLERMALMRPYDAVALRSRAAQARQQAEVERDRAATFSHPRQPQGTSARPAR
jgi:Arc/MetJ family transcription regulator